MNIEKRILTNANLPVSKKVVVNLLFSYGIINGKLNDVLKPHDISIQQFNVLRILRGQKGKPATLSSIQERMINKMSNTTRLIDKLIIKGYVGKEINKNNKRKIDVTITKEGLNFLNDIDILIDSTEQNIVKTLSNDEAQELIRLLGKIRLIAN
ncbi:MarR family winged helix-turn-helix transcriptional regulator [Aestuariivivens sediminis]|uniref:MarR family winged helix-turn-helix transcriptional regulator n=1 Tax=Aestuariivivens sediminis TaxID=2913557 RepID=UPI001F596BE5|nr:MarR family transcriptional regulator [Aestuariivivens sediminis]